MEYEAPATNDAFREIGIEDLDPDFYWPNNRYLTAYNLQLTREMQRNKGRKEEEAKREAELRREDEEKFKQQRDKIIENTLALQKTIPDRFFIDNRVI